MKYLQDIFQNISSIIQDIKEGKLIIVADNENRENEGDIVTSAQFITKEKMNFIISKAKGLVCAPMSQTYIDHFDLGQMVIKNTDNYGTKFTVSIDAKEVHTGISASERAFTILSLCKPNKTKDDFKRPGHIFPLLAEEGGVLTRNGHTEASIDIMKLSELKEISIICEIIGDDGEMLRKNNLIEFASSNNLKITSIEEVFIYRLFHENTFKNISSTTLINQSEYLHLYKATNGQLFQIYQHTQNDKNPTLKIIFDQERNIQKYKKNQNVVIISHLTEKNTPKNTQDYISAALLIQFLKEQKLLNSKNTFDLIDSSSNTSIIIQEFLQLYKKKN